MVDDMNSLSRWLVGQSLPFWGSRGFDGVNARFHERLDLGGRPLAVSSRVMVQARQIYVFAHAAQLGWFDGGATLAERAMRSLRRDFEETSGGASSFAYSTGPQGSRLRDTYAHAFILFAVAWLHRVTGDSGLVALADAVNLYVERQLFDPVNGGLFHGSPTTDRSKRQNPHMHLLEAYLALDASMPHRGHLDRARRLVRLFRSKIFRPDDAIVPEYAAEDWLPHGDASKRDVFEPGHHFEWVWLLWQYGRATGDSCDAITAPLLAKARAHGFDDGLIVDECLAGGTVVKRSRRLWPHTEAVKAAVVQHRCGDPSAAAFARDMVDALQRHFLGRPFAAGWIDHLDAAMSPMVDYVPASSLYHLVLAASEMSSAFDGGP